MVVVDGFLIVVRLKVTLVVALGVVVEFVVVDGLTVVVLAASVVFELDEKKPITLSMTPSFLVFVAFAENDLIIVPISSPFVAFSTFASLSFSSGSFLSSVGFSGLSVPSNPI